MFKEFIFQIGSQRSSDVDSSIQVMMRGKSGDVCFREFIFSTLEKVKIKGASGNRNQSQLFRGYRTVCLKEKLCALRSQTVLFFCCFF